MPKLKKDDKAKRELLEKIERICNQLPLWDLFLIWLYISGVKVKQNWNKIGWSWLLFQLELDKQIKSFLK